MALVEYRWLASSLS